MRFCFIRNDQRAVLIIFQTTSLIALSCCFDNALNCSVPIPAGRFLLALRLITHAAGTVHGASASSTCGKQFYLAALMVAFLPTPSSLKNWKPNKYDAPIIAVESQAADVGCTDVTLHGVFASGSFDGLVIMAYVSPPARVIFWKHTRSTLNVSN